jgi:NADH-quinone oxidoreductase subunit M
LITVAVFALTVWVAIPAGPDAPPTRFDLSTGRMQSVVSVPWIPALGIDYFLGLDGISFPLLLLTSFLSVLAMAASWKLSKHVKGYCILFLLLETGMLGVFVALDFFLFYVFWEVMLLPMYFLIGIWGGPRREYAAIKFFLFTLVGSVLILIGLLILYFASDARLLSAEQRAACHLAVPLDAAAPIEQGSPPVHTLNILALAEIGQLPHSPFDRELCCGKSRGWWAFVLLFIGFAIKLPAVPLHTWLPDAHVEAPTPISMILAGVLLKMGGYGVLRICYPICPAAAYELAWLVCAVGVVSMFYGAFAALAQTDFKRLVAYSSVSHMGYVLLGIGVWSATACNQYASTAWQIGISGAIFQMIAHGLSSAGMFFLVGVVYDRVHHRELSQFGGLFHKMPVYSGISVGIFFAALGLPGLCGFVGEFLVLWATAKYSLALAATAAAVVILTAGYILWTIQRVYLGPQYTGPHPEALTPMTVREGAISIPLLALAVLLGVYPPTLLNYVTPSVQETVEKLTRWTMHHERAARHSGARTSQARPDPPITNLPPTNSPWKPATGDPVAPFSSQPLYNLPPELPHKDEPWASTS